ncbi:MAG TPA: flippase [Patescibacteria group bacterium]|nr:flippase [Patescibacteria group bacterium]
MNGDSIVRNTAYYTVASVGQKIISFVYFSLVARMLGPVDTGKYYFTLTFTTIFVVLVDLGLTNVLIREAARNKEKSQAYLANVLWCKLGLGVLTYILLVLAINLLGYPVEIRHLVYVSGLTMLFDSFHLSIYGLLRSLGSLKYEAAGVVGSQLLTLIIGTIALFTHQPIICLIAAFTVASLFNLIYALIILYQRYRLYFYPHLDPAILRPFLRIAFPFALAAIFARVYSYIDTVLLSKLASPEVLGWYSIPSKITYAFQFIPLALVAAVYPRFSEFFLVDRERLGKVFVQAIKYLAVIVLPLSVGLFVLAQDIIISLYTVQFASSVLPLKILLLGLTFSYLGFPIGAILNATNRQKTQTVVIFLVMIVNVVANILLIPRLGAVGAAISASIGNLILAVLGYVFVPKVAPVAHWQIGRNLILVLVCALGMGLVVGFVNNYTHYLMAIVAGMVIYPLFLFLFRVVSWEEIRTFTVLFKREKI